MNKPQDSQFEYRKCPDCAEWVKAEARICRFCRTKLTPLESGAVGNEEKKQNYSSRFNDSGFKVDGKVIGIALGILCLLGLLIAIVPGMINSGKTMTGKWVANPLANLGGTQANPPLISGEWEVDYEYNGQPFISNASFLQSGNRLTGRGVDKDGSRWDVDRGEIQGNRVIFGKKYANSPDPPTIYSGDFKYLETPEYTGWAMEGTYKATEAAPEQAVPNR